MRCSAWCLCCNDCYQTAREACRWTCVRSEGNPGYSGKQCLGGFGELSGMHTSWIPFDGIMLNLSSGLQGWTVTCGPAAGVGR